MRPTTHTPPNIKWLLLGGDSQHHDYLLRIHCSLREGKRVVVLRGRETSEMLRVEDGPVKGAPERDQRRLVGKDLLQLLAELNLPQGTAVALPIMFMYWPYGVGLP
jgi:hypothetical protein